MVKAVWLQNSRISAIQLDIVEESSVSLEDVEIREAVGSAVLAMTPSIVQVCVDEVPGSYGGTSVLIMLTPFGEREVLIRAFSSPS